jgi:biopolymer transport protein ExbD
MARKSRLELEAVEDPALDIAPLIDCAFLLLIYFLITSTMQPREGDLNTTFPTVQGEPDKEVLIDHLNVELQEDGTVLAGAAGSMEVMDSDPNSRTLPQLVEKLKEYKGAVKLAGAEPLVIIKADDGAKQQRFIDIIDSLAEVEISNVTMTGFKTEEQ